MMKKISFVFSLLAILLGLSTAANAQTWDFASLDANDAELMDADAANWYHSTESKKDRYSYTKALDKAAVTANGQEIAYTKGLLFTISAVASGEGNLRAGNDTSNKRMWLAGNSVITIPNLKAGYQITVSCMSSSKTDARGINTDNITAVSGDFNKTAMGTAASTNVGTVTADGDVTLTMNGAMYIYYIKVADPADEEDGSSNDDGNSDTPTNVTVDYSTSANAAKNQAVLTLKDGTLKYYNTELVSSIDIDGTNVTVNQTAGTYTFENTVTDIAFKKADAGLQGDVTNEDGKVNITEAKGWLESAYVKFEPFAGATKYNAYVKGGQYNDYTQVDALLVRDYGTYGRIDVVGLQKDAAYDIKVVPVDANGDEMTAAANEATSIAVKGYSRQGFAFMNGYVPGAYKADGTLKNGAKVFYITKNTAKTVKTTVKTGSKDANIEEITGFQAIIDAYQKGYDTTPIAFRFIGLVTKDDLDGISSSAEGIQIKGKRADSELNITIEGIGEDATVKGFGFLVRNAKGVEFRNIGIMRCMDDGISLDTDNSNIWIHHTDVFYGKSGSGDHAKGDGATDVKANSKNVTVSYNRYWDTGKTNMFGMTSESGENWISYDHNWFDHSDSRHPRIRTMSVHVWNNYFDNCAKYGVGATSGASVFVENNYFLKTKKPILCSLQGTDGLGSGTFSGENGGMIKAYGNYFDRNAVNFKYLTQKNPDATKGYDAYETATREDKVPDTEKTLAGGYVYNNFDTDASLMYTYTVDAADEVPSVVTGYYGAGRMNHGDITYTFNDNVGNDDTDSKIDSGLASLIDNYKSALVGFFGNDSTGSGDSGSGDSGSGDSGSGDSGSGDSGNTDTPAGTITCSFDKSGVPSTTFFTVNGNASNSKGSVTIDGTTYSTCLKMESSTSVKFTLTASYKMTLYFGATETASIKINGTKINGSSNSYSQTLSAGSYELTKDGSVNLFYIKLEPVTE